MGKTVQLKGSSSPLLVRSDHQLGSGAKGLLLGQIGSCLIGGILSGSIGENKVLELPIPILFIHTFFLPLVELDKHMSFINHTNSISMYAKQFMTWGHSYTLAYTGAFCQRFCLYGPAYIFYYRTLYVTRIPYYNN